jgi:hypothetical protein
MTAARITIDFICDPGQPRRTIFYDYCCMPSGHRINDKLSKN